MQNLSADLFLMDTINTTQKRRKHVTHLTMGKKTQKRLPIADDSLGTAEKICQVSLLKVETKLLQMTEIEKKTRHFRRTWTQIFHRHRVLLKQKRTYTKST